MNVIFLPLALALSLPDICGKIEYPNYVNEKGELVGKQYKTWFDDWVDHSYADPSGWMEDRNRQKKLILQGRCVMS